jgi:hypothetical protein
VRFRQSATEGHAPDSERFLAATSSAVTSNSFQIEGLFKLGASSPGTLACISIAKFELDQQGSGNKLVFDRTGFPVGLARHLADGWQEHYWGAYAEIPGLRHQKPATICFSKLPHRIFQLR